MTSPRRLRATLHYNKRRILQLLALARVILHRMSASPALYGSSPVSLSTLAGQTAELDGAQLAVRMRVGLASFRDEKRDALITSLEALRAFVQGLADGAGEQAASLIEGAGMKVGALSTRSKPLLEARRGLRSGSVEVLANAKLLAPGKKRRFFSWQYTTDGGATWHDAPSTPFSRTTIEDLPPLTVCGFRVTVTRGGGTGPWSDMVTVVVH